MAAGGFLDFHGDLDTVGQVALSGDHFHLRDAALITGAGDVSIVATGAATNDLYGNIEASGAVSLDAPTVYLRQACRIRTSGDVTLRAPVRYDMRGQVTDNAGAVTITAGEYRLYGSHDLSGNAGGCAITGVADPASVPANGCTEGEGEPPPDPPRLDPWNPGKQGD